MWPGANLPAGPPPAGPAGPGGPVGPPPIKPAAGWYALPITLAALAILVFLVPLAFLWDDSEAADGPSAKGDLTSGVTVEARAGYSYFVYIRADGTPPSGCSFHQGGDSRPAGVSDGDGWVADEHSGWKYAATVESTVDGSALLRCRSGGGEAMVRPDDSSYLYLGLAMFAALGFGVLAAAALPIIMLRRSSSRRRLAAVMGPPYGY